MGRSQNWWWDGPRGLRLQFTAAIMDAEGHGDLALAKALTIEFQRIAECLARGGLLFNREAEPDDAA